MVRVLDRGASSRWCISILVGPRFIEFLRRNEFGQHIREEGPSDHVVKQGTPTMGGLLILLARRDRRSCALSKYTAAGADRALRDARAAARSASSTTSSS